MASNLLLSDTSTSTNNRQFVLQALKDGIRSDGRYPLDRRRLQIKWRQGSREWGEKLKLRRLDMGLRNGSGPCRQGLWEWGEKMKLRSLNCGGGRRIGSHFSGWGAQHQWGLGGRASLLRLAAAWGSPQTPGRWKALSVFPCPISSMASQVAADAVMGGSALSALFEAEKELRRLLEQSLLNTRCVDREALCVIPGLKVWNLQVEVVVMEVGGNVEDAVVLAALAALKKSSNTPSRGVLLPTCIRGAVFPTDWKMCVSYRLEEVCFFQSENVETETGAGTEKRANVIDKDVKEAQPLHFHQQVFPVSFAVFPGEFLVVDPNADEEAASQGRVFLALTGTGRLCVIQKLGGVGVPFEQVGELVKLADKQMKEISKEVEEAISSHAQVRDAARIRRRAAVAPSRTGRSITILPSTNLQPQPDLEDDEEEEEGEEGRDGAGDAAVPHPSEGHSRMDVDSGQERQKKKKKRRPQEGAGEGSDWRAAASARRIERAGQDTATMAAIIAGSQLGSAEKPDLENAIKAKKPAARPSS
eukprot:jgi/Botrbrau1/8223/Bobra.0392s0019.1